MAIEIEQTKYEVLPEGVYTAEITSCEETSGQYGEQLKVEFCVVGGDHDGATLRKWYNAKFSPKSNLYALTKAALNRTALPEEMPFRDRDILGRRVQVFAKVASGDRGQYNKVSDVAPLANMMPQAPRPPAARNVASPAISYVPDDSNAMPPSDPY